MNPADILALIGDLYGQLKATQTELAQEREINTALTQRIQALEAEPPHSP